MLAIIPALFLQLAYGQTDRKSNSGKAFRIAFYNVENLFDTIDDPRIDDNDFLPEAEIPWTTERYEVKLNHLARVIQALSGWAVHPAKCTRRLPISIKMRTYRVCRNNVSIVKKSHASS